MDMLSLKLKCRILQKDSTQVGFKMPQIELKKTNTVIMNNSCYTTVWHTLLNHQIFTGRWWLFQPFKQQVYLYDIPTIKLYTMASPLSNVESR